MAVRCFGSLAQGPAQAGRLIVLIGGNQRASYH